MTDIPSGLHPRLPIYIAVLATVIVYWAGLQGPFLLDDLPNFAPLQAWLDGRASALEVILGNTSGMLGRPVSMASLWASAATGGMHPFPFKLGNLLTHVLCGLIGWQLLRRLLAEDPRFALHANLAASMLAALWLLHPINVSTVLYAVQRMAQLSALFALLSLLTYVVARRQLADGNVRSATLKLFVLFPVLLLAGMLSKENAAVIPALCLVVELAYFTRQPRTAKVLPVFYAAFLLLPALAAMFLLTTEPERFLNHAGRDFTLVERLLSQPRALMEYIGLILWPRGGLMGLFVDDFRHSTGLLSPLSTLFALLALIGASLFAILLRRQAPTFFAGWFFFLVAHGVESTVLPLELYFEHRNYLPGFGLWLAMAGLLQWLAGKARLSEQKQGKAGLAIAAVMAIAFTTVTWQQVRVWRTQETIALQALEHRPTSLRATLSLVTSLVENGRMDEARALVQRLIDDDQSSRNRLLGYVHATTIDCLRGQGGSLTLLKKAENTGVTFLTIPEAQAYAQLSRAIGAGRCGPTITDSTVADSITHLLVNTPGHDDTSHSRRLLRTTAASMYLHADRWQEAEQHAQLAWGDGHADTAIGGMLTQIYVHNGNRPAAQKTLDQVRDWVTDYQRAANEGIEQLQLQIDAMPE